MTKLLVVFAIAMALAYKSELNTKTAIAAGWHYTPRKDWAFVGLVIVLVLFAGLRTSYNDTWNYIDAFYSAPGVAEWLTDSENYNPFTNPLFYFYQSVIKSVLNDTQMLIFISALITQLCFLNFFKRYAKHFTFSIFLYFTLGTYVFTLAAIKQVLGMAVVTLAFPYLEKKKWIPYYLIVLIAALFHTYAIAFVVLPFFRRKPWGIFTFLFVIITAILMMNFETAITEFMDQANDLGKTLADYEVFDDATINVFRLGVYAVPPAISFIFQKWVLRDATKIDHVMIHMSIISLAFMVMGTQSGANMFGRMANYFELGTICCLPIMLEKIFEDRSYKLIVLTATVCFLGFFFYANMNFEQQYTSISLMQFIQNQLTLILN